MARRVYGSGRDFSRRGSPEEVLMTQLQQLAAEDIRSAVVDRQACTATVMTRSDERITLPAWQVRDLGVANVTFV